MCLKVEEGIQYYDLNLNKSNLCAYYPVLQKKQSITCFCHVLTHVVDTEYKTNVMNHGTH